MRRLILCLASSLVLGLAATAARPQLALGAGGGGAGGAGSTSSGSASSGSASSGSASSGSASSGAGGAGPNCSTDGICEALSEDCTCADCMALALCVPDQCVTDGLCDLKDACICADCRSDDYCNNPEHCLDDGKCDSFIEGCECADCAQKVECLSGPPASTSTSTSVASSGSTSGASTSGASSSGAGGSGDAVGEGGCTTRPGGPTPWIPIVGALIFSGAALLGRRRRR